MDAELARRAAGLPDRYADRIPQAQLDGLRSLARGGEYGELVDALAAGLVKRSQAVTPAERDELRELADATGEGAEYVGRLVVG